MNGDEGPARHPAIETAVFGNEAVLYDERSGMVHHLNAAAYAIWELLDGRRVENVVEALARRVDISPGDIRRDVAQAIADFDAAGLLTHAGGSPP